ncbi:MAG: adenosine deaminase [Fimbriimonadaceae bacterium]
MDRAWIASLPKIELHVHIEGSIRPETVLRLAQKNGIRLPAQDLDGLREFYRFRDFPHFVEVYVAVTQCVKDEEDLYTVFTEFLQGQAAQNIVYTEATYTASTVESHCGIPWPRQLEAIKSAITDSGERLGLVLDIVRGQSVEDAFRVLDWVQGALGGVVCALGLAGEERKGTSEYRPVFDEAHRAGVPVTVHAGETCGAESVAEVLDVCRPHRIGHGVRAIEDDSVVARLRDSGILLEVCPSSNVCLGVVPSLAEHPLPELRAADLRVTVNSDDPPMFGTTLTDELVRCSEAFGWSESTLLAMNADAARSAFLPERERETLLAAVLSTQGV